MADATEDTPRHPPSLDPDDRPTKPTPPSNNTADNEDGEDEEEELAQDYTPLARSTLPYNPTAPDILLTAYSLDEPLPPHALAHTNTPTTPHDQQTNSATTTATTLLPRRGEKDFEPHPTDAQARHLASSRAAMHVALSHARVHAPRARVLGVYDARSGCVRVRRRRGVWLSTCGRDLPGGGVELLAEEALWALEGGRLDVRYGLDPDDEGDQEGDGVKDEDAAEERLLPMSLQGAYAAFLGEESERTGGRGLTLEKYVVYAGLKRAGFIVTRAEGFFGLKKVRTRAPEQPQRAAKQEQEQKQPMSLLAWLSRLFTTRASEEAERERQRWGPLVKPGIYRSYQDIFRLLQVIPAPSPLDPSPAGDAAVPIDDDDSTTIETPYTTTYNIHQPNTHFKKRSPPPPDFRVCVVAARDTSFPTPAQLDSLLEEQPPDDPPAAAPPGKASAGKANPTREFAETKRSRTLGATYGAIKRGRCSVLIAVVEEGVVSYMRVSEGGFVDEGRLFEREGGGNERKKGGGRGGRGGRGRGRGRARG